MRLAFFVLLLANAVLLVWAQGLFGTRDEGREPERVKRQLEPEKLRIVRDVPAPPAAPPPAPAAASVVAAPACKRIEWLSASDAAAVRDATAALAGWTVSQPLPRQDPPAYWVVIPELTNRAAAEKKKGELRDLGVKEGEVVETPTAGPFAVSLGVFRSQQLANDFLQSLAKHGVRSARLAQRELPPDRFALELRAPTDQFDRLPTLIPPQAQFRIVDCLAP